MPESIQIAADLDVYELVQVLGLALLHALLLSFAVAKCGKMLTDRSQYTGIFLVLIPTMVLIITIVKSSLALSLGLVGALSIVRFRTPVKEPEELTYLFLAIAAGLGLGAGQLLITNVSIAFVVVVMFAASACRRRTKSQGVFIDVDAKEGSLKTVAALLDRSTVDYEMRRFMDREDGISATFYVDAAPIEDVALIIEDVKQTLLDAEVTVLDTRRQLS
tara:strand:+ start:315905 stop:316561 length:657 start_codon:yes stop_codon:yes gene_type:complete